jgi:hypothetical protein
MRIVSISREGFVSCVVTYSVVCMGSYSVCGHLELHSGKILGHLEIKTGNLEIHILSNLNIASEVSLRRLNCTLRLLFKIKIESCA